MGIYKTESLHFSCFLLCDNYKLIDVCFNKDSNMVEFLFEPRPGIDMGNLYRSWLVDSYKVPAREVFVQYGRLRDLMEEVKKQSSEKPVVIKQRSRSLPRD